MSTELKIKQLKAEILEQHESQLNGLLSLCESEIERLFLLNVINYFESTFGIHYELTGITYSEGDLIYEDGNYYTSEKGMQRNREGRPVYPYSYKVNHHLFTLEMIPQYEITLNNRDYRLDFLFLIDRVCSATQESKAMICVECDGYEFHERTVEQVDKDNQKDADLMTNGLLVFRYSGSKIYRSSSFSSFKEIINHILTIALKYSKPFPSK